LNNFISKLFSLVFCSDRFACIALIEEKDYDEYARNNDHKKVKLIIAKKFISES